MNSQMDLIEETDILMIESMNKEINTEEEVGPDPPSEKSIGIGEIEKIDEEIKMDITIEMISGIIKEVDIDKQNY